MSGIENPAYKDHELEIFDRGREKMGTSRELGSIVNHDEKLTECTKGEETRKSRLIRILRNVLINAFVISYFSYASYCWWQKNNDWSIDWCNGYGMLVILIVVVYFTLIYYCVFKRYLRSSVLSCCRPISDYFSDLSRIRYVSIGSKVFFTLLVFTLFTIFIIIDTAGSRDRLISCIGVVTLLLLGWVFSKSRRQIKWRPIIGGLMLQIALGILIIRWEVGRQIFHCLADKVASFLDNAKVGATFVFSKQIVDNGVFAFTVLPVIFFFSFIIQILYYLGAMQWVIMKIGWSLKCIMDTTVCESLIAAANTFLGMSESPLLIKPYIDKLTNSELHAVMCSGFASVSGTVLAAYIGFGAEPAHLITASVMSAPASLCFSKLFYPETEKSLTSFKNIKLQKSEDTSVLDAATKGAVAGIPLVLGIVANIVAFVSFVAFINSMLFWLGGLVGIEDLSLECILSKVFMPVSWMLGVPWDQCEYVGTLIGLKSVVNEFVAYQKLGEFKLQGKLSPRSEAIATYAICGFANPGSVGIMIGCLTAIAPQKRRQITQVAFRAFVAGTLVCFLTASVAGMLMTDEFYLHSNSTTSTS